MKDATEDTNKKALDFLALARAKANQTADPAKKVAAGARSQRAVAAADADDDARRRC